VGRAEKRLTYNEKLDPRLREGDRWADGCAARNAVD
jgi:hypothetical protein